MGRQGRRASAPAHAARRSHRTTAIGVDRRRGLHAAIVPFAVLAVAAVAVDLWDGAASFDLAAQLDVGRRVYVAQCAACHGLNLEGQPNWRQRLANGRLPAPPHDATGHTWHHADAVLFGITKEGLVPGRYGPPGYESDMPAFKTVLSDDEIRAVIVYIKSTWPEGVRAKQQAINRRHYANR
jgi:S-disulfanyl-L-cysteine oxidoreductase SoxD